MTKYGTEGATKIFNQEEKKDGPKYRSQGFGDGNEEEEDDYNPASLGLSLPKIEQEELPIPLNNTGRRGTVMMVRNNHVDNDDESNNYWETERYEVCNRKIG